jgi:hypothetical protein
MITKNWLKFIFLQLPLALICITLTAEFLAWALRDYPPIRHPLDRLLAAQNHIPLNADILLFGDSVTQDVAGRYALLPEGKLGTSPQIKQME